MSMLPTPDLGALGLSYVLFVVLVAAVVRGYTGFGLSALVVSGASLVLEPSKIVPIAVLLEVAASIHMLPMVWKNIDWRTLGWVSLGMVVATPIGVHLLASLPVAPMRVIISILVLIATFLMWRGYGHRGHPSKAMKAGTGMISGLMNGAAALGGLPVVIFLLSTLVGAAVSRAILVAYLFGTGVVTTLISGTRGLITNEVLVLTGLCLIPLFVGVTLGNLQFVRAQPESFRRFALLLLVVLSLLGLIRAYFD